MPLESTFHLVASTSRRQSSDIAARSLCPSHVHLFHDTAENAATVDLVQHESSRVSFVVHVHIVIIALVVYNQNSSMIIDFSCCTN